MNYGGTCPGESLKRLAVKVINRSEDRISVVSVGLWRRGTWEHWFRRIFVPLDYDSPQNSCNSHSPEEPTVVKFSRESDPKPEHKPIRIEARECYTFYIDEGDGRSDKVPGAAGVYIRLGDMSTYAFPSWWRTLVSADAREAGKLFDVYKQRVADDNKRRDENLAKVREEARERSGRGPTDSGKQEKSP